MEVVAATNLGGRRPPWQDLPSELLGLVLQRVLSHADRVRLRAVCRQWRAGARLQPPLPPLLPWLALRDGSFLALSDGEVHRRGLARDANVAHRVSTGCKLFLVHNDKGSSCSLMNPLARETTAPQRINLSRLRTRRGVLLDAGDIRKVVVMSDHVTAVQRGSEVRGGKVITISIRRPQSTTVEWQWQWMPHHHVASGTYCYCPHPYRVLDMALFRHKLYVLTAAAVGLYHPLRLRLYAMDVVGDSHVNVRRVFMRPEDDVDRWHRGGPRHYLVASGDRLLMVKQTSPLLMPAWFEVLEAADISGGGRGRWRDVETLMGRALFVSEGCSETLPAGDGKHGGARQDCIYFLKERNNYDGRTSALYSGVYDMRRGTVSPLPVDTVVPHDGSLTATWFFPPDT